MIGKITNVVLTALATSTLFISNTYDMIINNTIAKTETTYEQDEIETQKEIITERYRNETKSNSYIMMARDLNQNNSYLAEHEYFQRYYLIVSRYTITNYDYEDWFINDFYIGYPHWPLNQGTLPTLNVYGTNLEDLTQDTRNFIEGTSYQNYQELENAMFSINDDRSNSTLLQTITINPPANTLQEVDLQISSTYDTVILYMLVEFDGQSFPENETLTGTTLSSGLGFQLVISYTAQVNTDNYEVIDIPGLAFTILGMPFAWISTAFNLTLWPGTPYEINIAYMLMGLIAVLIVGYIIKRVLK